MAQPAPPNTIALDEDEGIADLSDITSSTASLRSSVLNFPVQHGRQYQALGIQSYHRPNDEDELDRLDLMSELLKMVNDGKLHTAPIPPSPQRILDIGTGTGLWAINMGDFYPSAQIIGIDISPSMPNFVPPNVIFQIDDVEEPWTFVSPFDYIHSRYMAGSIKDWPKLMAQCFEFTRPGGFVEFQDFDIDYYSQDGSLTKQHALKRWLDTCYATVDITGRSLKPGPHLEAWMRDAGFVNVHAVQTPLPIGRWPKDQKMKRIGALNWTQIWEGLVGLSLRMYIDILGWSREELEMLLYEVRQDLRNPKIHAMFDVYTVWGQRPES